MANQYSRLTAENILIKMNRQRNPVTSVVQLAREFGVNTSYRRIHDYYGRSGRNDERAPQSFSNKVKALIGEEAYNRLRVSANVNLAYR